MSEVVVCRNLSRASLVLQDQISVVAVAGMMMKVGGLLIFQKTRSGFADIRETSSSFADVVKNGCFVDGSLAESLTLMMIEDFQMTGDCR